MELTCDSLAEWLPDLCLLAVDGDEVVRFWRDAATAPLTLALADVVDKPLASHPQLSSLAGHGLFNDDSRPGDTVSLTLRGSTRTLQVIGNVLTCDALRLRALLPLNAGDSSGASPQSVGRAEVFHGIHSRDLKMRQAFDIVRNVAPMETTILVRGESGTGKELLARAVHLESGRSEGPFVAINCAVLSQNLLESELFGHVKGAFTGAIRDHSGVFERAGGGTIFLDEVAELPLDLQAKLLRVIQEREFTPLGSERLLKADVRVVAATHRSLREEVAAGRFREDLMYRLRVVPIFLPPLRERREDISYLIWRFIDALATQANRRIEQIHPDAMRRLLDHHWPGNVRELRNVVEYAYAVGRGKTLTLQDLPPEFGETMASAAPGKIATATQTNEAAAIEAALQATGGRVSAAAERLGMSRATFWRKRKQLLG